jgi:hypothetical protein
MTTKQDDMNRNPNGKGGFGEHPENRSDGRWSKENSYTYWLHFFMKMKIDEFKTYDPDKNTEMTMAARGAWSRIAKSSRLNEFREVANRTEGMPRQSTDLTSNGQTLTGLVQINEDNTVKSVADNSKKG